jgi:hypothetical protein
MPHWSTTLVSLVGICKKLFWVRVFWGKFYTLHWAPVNLLYIRAHECVQVTPCQEPWSNFAFFVDTLQGSRTNPCCLAKTQGLKFRFLYNLGLWLLLTVTQTWPLLVTVSNLWVMNQIRADICDTQLSLIMWRDSTLKPMQWAHRTMWRVAYSLAESS